MSPYERLLELTRCQQELITGARWDEAVAAGEQWQQLADTLPDEPPEEARTLLEQAADLAWSNTATIEAHAAAVVRELEHLGRGRRAIASYASSGR